MKHYKYYGPTPTILLLLCSCAGPSTPLGALGELGLPQKTSIKEETSFESELPTELKAKIQFYPSRQVLHRASPLSLKINDPYYQMKYRNHDDLLRTLDDKYRLGDFKVIYSGWDITQSILDESRLTLDRDKNLFILSIPKLTLSPHENHEIRVLYRNSWGTLSVSQYAPPQCNIEETLNIKNTDNFSVPSSFIDLIQTASLKERLNPSLFAGMIAQESSFNPKAASWAKALGLTQMTPIAEREIIHRFPSFPRFPGIQNYSALRTKILVRTGTINEKNEWRLNPRTSTLGGAAYASHINQLWSTPENINRIRKTFSKNLNVEKTKLILASYHSGYSRVSYALTQLRENWKTSVKLKESNPYVNKVMSYCHHFSKNPHKEI